MCYAHKFEYTFLPAFTYVSRILHPHGYPVALPTLSTIWLFFFFFQYLTLPALTRTIGILETQGLLQPRNEAIVRLQGISSVQCSRY